MFGCSLYRYRDNYRGDTFTYVLPYDQFSGIYGGVTMFWVCKLWFVVIQLFQWIPL